MTHQVEFHTPRTYFPEEEKKQAPLSIPFSLDNVLTFWKEKFSELDWDKIKNWNLLKSFYLEVFQQNEEIKGVLRDFIPGWNQEMPTFSQEKDLPANWISLEPVLKEFSSQSIGSVSPILVASNFCSSDQLWQLIDQLVGRFDQIQIVEVVDLNEGYVEFNNNISSIFKPLKEKVQSSHYVFSEGTYQSKSLTGIRFFWPFSFLGENPVLEFHELLEKLLEEEKKTNKAFLIVGSNESAKDALLLAWFLRKMGLFPGEIKEEDFCQKIACISTLLFLQRGDQETEPEERVFPFHNVIHYFQATIPSSGRDSPLSEEFYKIDYLRQDTFLKIQEKEETLGSYEFRRSFLKNILATCTAELQMTWGQVRDKASLYNFWSFLSSKKEALKQIIPHENFPEDRGFAPFSYPLFSQVYFDFHANWICLDSGPIQKRVIAAQSPSLEEEGNFWQMVSFLFKVFKKVTLVQLEEEEEPLEKMMYSNLQLCMQELPTDAPHYLYYKASFQGRPLECLFSQTEDPIEAFQGLFEFLSEKRENTEEVILFCCSQGGKKIAPAIATLFLRELGFVPGKIQGSSDFYKMLAYFMFLMKIQRGEVCFEEKDSLESIVEYFDHPRPLKKDLSEEKKDSLDYFIQGRQDLNLLITHCKEHLPIKWKNVGNWDQLYAFFTSISNQDIINRVARQVDFKSHPVFSSVPSCPLFSQVNYSYHANWICLPGRHRIIAAHSPSSGAFQDFWDMVRDLFVDFSKITLVQLGDFSVLGRDSYGYTPAELPDSVVLQKDVTQFFRNHCFISEGSYNQYPLELIQFHWFPDKFPKKSRLDAFLNKLNKKIKRKPEELLIIHCFDGYAHTPLLSAALYMCQLGFIPGKVKKEDTNFYQKLAYVLFLLRLQRGPSCISEKSQLKWLVSYFALSPSKIQISARKVEEAIQVKQEVVTKPVIKKEEEKKEAPSTTSKNSSKPTSSQVEKKSSDLAAEFIEFTKQGLDAMADILLRKNNR